MEVIQLQEVTRVYRIGEVETRALRGVSLKLESGEFAAIVGPSGSGKTTMLQLMGCLDRPTTGHVIVKGQDVAHLNANKRADLRKGTIGFVFQFFALIPGLTAYENIELPLLLTGEKASERRERVKDLLQAVGLSGRARHRPDQMSGGEQQRVAVARALATHPLLVLADEPTANLDTENGRQVMEIMQRLNKETGTTFVFATHDPRV
ncbi:MAG: ABC transporter ATP-binding protein, partial [Anaerolineales bacterium]